MAEDRPSPIKAVTRAVARVAGRNAADDDVVAASPGTGGAAKAGATKTGAAKSAAKKTGAKKTGAKKTGAKRAGATNTGATRAGAKKTGAKKAAGSAVDAGASTTKAPRSEPSVSATGPTGKRSVGRKTAGKKTAASRPAAKKAAAPSAAGTKRPASARTTKVARTANAVAGRSPAKVAARKAATALAVRAGDRPWTAREVADVRGLLQSDKDRLQLEISAVEEEIGHLLREGGEGAGHDQADVGSNTFERDHEMSMAKNARDNLTLVQEAISRIDDGTYGVCESCGNPIGKMRLQAFPRATLCMECKQRQERR